MNLNWMKAVEVSSDVLDFAGDAEHRITGLVSFTFQPASVL